MFWTSFDNANKLDRNSIETVGIYFSAAVLILEDTGKQGGIVVAKTLAKVTFSIAALAAATWVGTSSSRAYGDAPWCALINIGQGTVYWDCQYPTFEACYHLGNILAGNRGFCNLNPWPGPPYRHQQRYSPY